MGIPTDNNNRPGPFHKLQHFPINLFVPSIGVVVVATVVTDNAVVVVVVRLRSRTAAR